MQATTKERQTVNSQLYTLEDAARLLGGISPWFLRKAIIQGTVSRVKLGRRVFLSSEEVARIQKQGLPSLK